MAGRAIAAGHGYALVVDTSIDVKTGGCAVCLSIAGIPIHVALTVVAGPRGHHVMARSARTAHDIGVFVIFAAIHVVAGCGLVESRHTVVAGLGAHTLITRCRRLHILASGSHTAGRIVETCIDISTGGCAVRLSIAGIPIHVANALISGPRGLRVMTRRPGTAVDASATIDISAGGCLVVLCESNIAVRHIANALVTCPRSHDVITIGADTTVDGVAIIIETSVVV
jgi:hypothetical protein